MSCAKGFDCFKDVCPSNLILCAVYACISQNLYTLCTPVTVKAQRPLV